MKPYKKPEDKALKKSFSIPSWILEEIKKEAKKNKRSTSKEVSYRLMKSLDINNLEKS